MSEKLSDAQTTAHDGKSGTEIVCDVLIIGAGPAGLFAGISLLEHAPHTRVVIIDHVKKPGRKLLIAGGGQCNFTHAGSIKEFLTHYDADPSLIRKILYSFNNEALRLWFKDRGVESVEREDGKVFPASLKSGDVLTALLHAFQSMGGVILQSVEPSEISIDAEQSENVQNAHQDSTRGDTAERAVTLTARLDQDSLTLKAHACVMATGGCTYPKTGSDGSFLEIVKDEFLERGIAVRPLESALSPLYIKDYPFKDLEGLSVVATVQCLDAQMSATPLSKSAQRKRRLNQPTPKGLLFRSDSFSGPAAMDASAYAQVGGGVRINFAPHINNSGDAQALSDDLFAQSHTSQKETLTLFQNFFDLPKRLAEALFAQSERQQKAPYKHLARDLSKKECRALVGDVVEARFEIARLGSEGESMVSRGGICLDEINPATMQLKKMPAMFVAGECIDATGDTGGYNLQWAFSSARRAGQALAEYCAQTGITE